MQILNLAQEYLLYKRQVTIEVSRNKLGLNNKSAKERETQKR